MTERNGDKNGEVECEPICQQVQTIDVDYLDRTEQEKETNSNTVKSKILANYCNILTATVTLYSEKVGEKNSNV